MLLTYVLTAELDAPLAAVRAYFGDAAHWPALLPGLERAGARWRYAGERYELQCGGDAAQMRWDATTPADPDRHLRVEVALDDALIATRVSITATLRLADSPLALLRKAQWRRRLAAACARALAEVRRQGAVGEAASRQSPMTSRQSRVSLAARYPRTVAAFAEMGASEHLERVLRLDAVWGELRGQPTNDQRPATNDQRPTTNAQLPTPNDQLPIANCQLPAPPPAYDLIYAGGGLGLLHAAVMARRYGWRVLLFDRGEVGCAHREWNISRAELAALVALGFCTWDDLRAIVMAEYERGVVRFYAGARQPAELWMHNVLDVALDAGALLQFARRQLEAAGGTVLDQCAFQRISVSDAGPVHVAVEVMTAEGATESYTARLLLDGMGSISPLARERFAGQPFAGVCPTVGTVVAGLVAGDAPDEHNPRVGDILLSVADAQRGQQYMWEGFPGRGDELTVYLFYYGTIRGQGTGDRGQKTRRRGDQETRRPAFRLGPRASRLAHPAPPDLMQLFEDYFALLPTYKRAGPHFRHLKPVYGYIPARHSVRRQEAALLRGVLPIGDSAAQQSPLTFCGFGSHVRNLDRTSALLDMALRHELLAPEHLRVVSPYQVNVSLNWVFSRFMQPWGGADDVNVLQNQFCAVLNDLGAELTQRYFRDQMRWGDYHKLVLGMFRRHPDIVTRAWRVLGGRGFRQWGADYLAFSGAALLAWAGRRIGGRGRAVLLRVADRRSPAHGLRLRARYAEWRAMGW